MERRESRESEGPGQQTTGRARGKQERDRGFLEAGRETSPSEGEGERETRGKGEAERPEEGE